MYQLQDTIVAVSSPAPEKHVIIRITGPQTIDAAQQVFKPPIKKSKPGIYRGVITIDTELQIDATVYLFLAPKSYTGEDLVEIHLNTNQSVTEALMNRFLNITDHPLRMAGPGEFTARSFLNGKIDLSQAEAVNEVIVSSNRLQLTAAEKLLAGRLAKTIADIRSQILDCLSLIEAGLDFSTQDIEVITQKQAITSLNEIKEKLYQLLSGSISFEVIIDLPSVGIAAAPNTGKSSLLNKMLGRKRSIVSHTRKTTRDVLTGQLELKSCRIVLFDCAGLIIEPKTVLDKLAQQAAIEALRSSSIVLFCVDFSKGNWAEDIAIRNLIASEQIIAVATKSDLLSKNKLTLRLSELNKLFATDFISTSSKTGAGLEQLLKVIDEKIVEVTTAKTKGTLLYEPSANTVTLTARHKQAVTEAIENVTESICEIKAGNDEITAMMLRAAYQELSEIEQQHIDEQILENIFSHFCIGK